MNFHLTVFGVGIVTLPSDRQFNISRQPQNRLNKDIYNNKTFHVGEITLGASQCAKIYANYQLIYLSNRQLCTIRLHVVSVRVSFFLHSSQHPRLLLLFIFEFLHSISRLEQTVFIVADVCVCVFHFLDFTVALFCFFCLFVAQVTSVLIGSTNVSQSNFSTI